MDSSITIEIPGTDHIKSILIGTGARLQQEGLMPLANLGSIPGTPDCLPKPARSTEQGVNPFQSGTQVAL